MKQAYKKHNEVAKQKLLDACNQGSDWKTVAITHDIPIRTAQRIISSGRVRNKPRGGTRKRKLDENMKQKLIQMLESNGTLTLREMSSAMMREFGIRVTPQCIAYNLNGMCFTLKTVREEPTAMNSEANIEKRKVFCQKLREAKRSENIIVYLDETNFNIHCSRKKA